MRAWKLLACKGTQVGLLARQQSFASAPQADILTSTKRLICAECGQKISFAEGKYCRNQSERFGGRLYCRERQKLF